RAAARLQAGRLHARAADRRAHPAHRDRGHGERAAEARLRPAGTARDPRARARRDPARELRDGAGRSGDRGGPGAVREPARRARGFAGAQAVVSNAALFSLRNRSWEDHHRANIQGTENVFGALADAAVKRVVHVSSVAVYRAHGPRVAEDAPQLTADTRRTL